MLAWPEPLAGLLGSGSEHKHPECNVATCEALTYFSKCYAYLLFLFAYYFRIVNFP